MKYFFVMSTCDGMAVAEGVYTTLEAARYGLVEIFHKDVAAEAERGNICVKWPPSLNLEEEGCSDD